MTDCQLIVDPPQPGAWNMAVDEWLLTRTADIDVPTLRFYQWSQPTLSLGYFQSHEEREAHAASHACPLLRRASGGGALVHDCELTYSLAVPVGHPLARDTQALYDRVHESLVQLLNTWLQPAGRFERVADTVRRADGEPFLCFLRRAEGDVVYAPPSGQRSPATPDGRAKVCGSAQRKHRGGVLQHGGVLLASSPAAPELPGVADLVDRAITPESVRERWVRRLGDQLELRLTEPDEPSPAERAQIAAIAAAKFADLGWTQRR